MGGGVDISLPNVSYCEDVKDIHYNPYNTVEFYVGEITPPQTVKIYTDETTSVDIQVSEGNKWYTYLLPKDKGLFRISGNTVNKVVVKANISYKPNFRPPFYYDSIIPTSTVEASFKGSNLNITDIKGMFQSCHNLTSLDVSSFDTSNVTDMSHMIGYCGGLTSLDLSGWDTSNVTDMSSMFNSCSGLTSLDLSNFVTSKVTSMNGMFQSCHNLTSLDVSNFNTSKVINMGAMFRHCTNLATLDLSGWDTSKVTSIYNMFSGCSKLKTIRMVDCSQDTRTKIQEQLTKDNITGVTIVTE